MVQLFGGCLLLLGLELWGLLLFPWVLNIVNVVTLQFARSIVEHNQVRLLPFGVHLLPVGVGIIELSLLVLGLTHQIIYLS